MSLRSWNSTLFKNLVKKLSVLSSVNVLCTCSENRNSHLHKALGELNRRLSTELDYSSVRLLQLNDILNILRCERFKVKLVRNIEVRTYSLRVVVYNDCLIAFLLECPCAVNRAVIKFDTLTDSDRT